LIISDISSFDIRAKIFVGDIKKYFYIIYRASEIVETLELNESSLKKKHLQGLPHNSTD
jgi:hypothetical protein